uniref:Uncharacterized protein n=1 Tax=Aegilops tauschii TaxID=37682 RepID=N1R348_AEGTA
MALATNRAVTAALAVVSSSVTSQPCHAPSFLLLKCHTICVVHATEHWKNPVQSI